MGALDPETVMEKREGVAAVEDPVSRAQEHEKEEEDEEEEVVVVNVDSGEREIMTTDPPLSTAHMSRLQTQHPVAPIQVAPQATPFQTPTPQSTTGTLSSRRYTNRISLFLFLLHFVAASAAISFFIYRTIQVLLDPKTPRARRERRALRYWLPPIEASAVFGIVLAFAWQKAVRMWPAFMINFILWFTFFATMSAGVLLICFSLPSTLGLGVAFVLFSIGTALYSCWVIRRVPFTARVFAMALHPVPKFRDLNEPAYLMMAAGFLWISLWCFAVIGAAQSFYYPPLTILGLVLSLAWTVEVMRNVVNLTVSRVIALYYLRGMQSSTQFCFQRAISYNLGSACLGSLFVPTIEALRIMARGINLMEDEDEFMFSCAHCCLRVMEFVFHYGNSWAFVHIAAYGRGFVTASKSTWGMFERQKMEELVDSDMSTSVCFLTGVSSGALCVILAASWTFATHKPYTATVSLLAFFVGYLMTRIAMALPHACVACYYVCYAENPGIRLFDNTIPERLNQLRDDRELAVPTPRFPRRPATA